MKRINNLVLFWSFKDVFSNFYPSTFTVKEFTFSSNEQFFMYSKARFFNDLETADKILKTKNPNDCKKLGRQVKNFNQGAWDVKSIPIMRIGLYHKFKQNPEMARELLATGNDILVEASPYDKLYGVGLKENDPRILDKSQWLGENRLGHLLMEVREMLLKELNQVDKKKPQSTNKPFKVR